MQKYLIPSVLLAVAAAITSARSQDAAGTAHVPGAISDGTLPPPSPPKPGFSVLPGDILETKIQTQGGRSITVREIAPIPLPSPPSPAPVVEISEAFRARIAEFRRTRPERKSLALGATVYRSNISPPRSLVHLMQPDGEPPVVLWSSADFSLLSGFCEFIGSGGEIFSFLMMWGVEDMDRRAQMLASRGQLYQPPLLPVFPEGGATFQIVSGEPSAETLLSIRSLHDVYQNELPRLQEAAAGREARRIQEAAELAANPPQAKDIILNHWRIEPAEEGAAR